MRRLTGTALLSMLLVTLTGTAANATFPGNNGLIAFVRGSTIYTAQPDGTGAKAFVAGTSPRWSADGKRLAFVRNGWIYTVNANGSGLTKLVQGFSPTWAPDGRKLAFIGNTDRICQGSGTDYWNWTYSIDLASKRISTIGVPYCVSDGVDEGLTMIAWSPDGKYLASSDWWSHNIDTGTEVAVINLATNKVTMYVQTSNNTNSSDPAWGPGGGTLLFVGDSPRLPGAGGGSHLYIIGANGQGLRRVASMAGAAHPVWSPNGGTPGHPLKALFDHGSGLVEVTVGTGNDAHVLISNASRADWQAQPK